jgi:D-xylose transport system ATP-binding protein
MDKFIFEMKDITKQVSGIRVLNNFSIKIKEGETHIIVAESEAGISTIINILTGEYPAGSYYGELIVNDEIKNFHSLGDSEKEGIGVVHQKPRFVEQMNIYENIFLGKEFTHFGIIDNRRCYRETVSVLKDVGLSYNPETRISRLNTSERQKIEFARLIEKKAAIIFLEDITTTITEREIDSLLDLLKLLKEKNFTIVYTGHRIKEVLRVSDRVTVMRDGKAIFTENAENFFDEEASPISLDAIKNGFIDHFCNSFDISKREKEVLKLLINGNSSREICLKLFISINTIKTHISNIYQKTGVNNRVELANLILKTKRY